MPENCEKYAYHQRPQYAAIMAFMVEKTAALVGRRLRRLRLRRGLTQNVLADKAVITRKYVSDLELGRYDVTVDVLRRLCKALRMTLEEFFEDFDL